MEKSYIIEQVEDFIERFDSEQLMLKPEAKETKIEITEDKDALGRPKKVRCSLADLIANEIAWYTRAKDALSKGFRGVPKYQRILFRSAIERNVDNAADALFKHIELARTNGLIEDVEIKKKLKECQEENEKLRKENANLRKMNVELAKENARLHKLFPDNKRGKTEVGDLSKP
jgi:hypothetical protein